MGIIGGSMQLSDIPSERIKVGMIELVEASMGAVTMEEVLIFYEKRIEELEGHFKDRWKIEEYAFMMLKRRLKSGCDIGESWP
jgi:hypothetical protein